LSRRLTQYSGRLRLPPGHHPLPGSSPVIGPARSGDLPQDHRAGEGLPSSRRHHHERSAPLTPGSPSGLHLQALHPFHGLRREKRGSALPCSPTRRRARLTTRQASLHATDRSLAPPNGAFDAGLRPGPFPDQAASLLPGLLAATRTGLPPAGNDEQEQITMPISNHIIGLHSSWRTFG
jgi:hypothetical protein